MRFRITVVLAALLMVAAGLSAQVNIRGGKSVTSCNDVEFSFDDVPGVRGEQRLQIGGNVLALRLGDGNGMPLKVVGSDRSGYEVLLCKAAEDAATLAAVALQQRGTELSVSSPGGRGEWASYVVVFAPRSAELSLEASNGPVSVQGIAGRLLAEISNGPLSLKDVGGRVEARASNGPISFRGGSGDVVLEAQNGPISIHLEGATWDGGELRTSTKNGPVTLHVPQAYASGIVVERGKRTPFNCPESLCGPRPEFFQDDQTQIAIGNGPARVHVAAKNGPISIKQK